MKINNNILNLKLISIIFIFSVIFLFPFSTKALTVSPIRYEISGDPGQVLEQKLSLRNETANSVTYYPHYYNFQAQGETGTPSFVLPTEGLGTWIAAPSGITLAPGDNQTVIFVISIPKDAHPGGYFGALLYGTTPPVQKGAQLAIGSETGPIILLRVNGEIKESASVLEFKTKNNQTYFNALPVEMYYRFQNTGADRTKPMGNLIIRNIFGIKAKTQNANPVEGNVLPGQIRKIDLVWHKNNLPEDNAYIKRGFFDQVFYEWKNFALGYFTASLDIVYGKENNRNSLSELNFFVFPWHLLIVLILLLGITLYILKILIRRYNRWIIKQAEIAIERMQEEKSDQADLKNKKNLKHRV